MRDLASLTAADFETAVDSAFEVIDGDAEAVPLRLTQVVSLGEQPGGRHAFSLRFRGPLAPALAHVIHHVEHPEMGELDLFLGPVAADSDGVTYEAIFG